MDWRTKVELFEEIRREYEFGIGTIAGVAKKLKVHRRMVREAIGSALPAPRKKTDGRAGSWLALRHSWTGSWNWIGRRRGSSVTPRTGSGSECERR